MEFFYSTANLCIIFLVYPKVPCSPAMQEIPFPDTEGFLPVYYPDSHTASPPKREQYTSVLTIWIDPFTGQIIRLSVTQRCHECPTARGL